MVLSIVRLVYSLLFMLVLPIIFCRLAYKGHRLPAYRQRWAERLGFVSFIADKDKTLKPIWVHAASMGEVISAIPLVKQLRSQHPNTPILITTMTTTGSERVLTHFKDELNNTIFHSYIPYDINWVMRRFLNRLSPIALIILETELWPNLLFIAHEKKIPIMIANARLSPSSVKSYARLGWMMKAILNQITIVAAQSTLDAKRYESLGLNPDKIRNIGNIKYDLNIPEGTLEKGATLRKRWEGTVGARPVWIAASTHPGEEKLILSIFANLQKKYPSLLLLLVPRHPNRFEEVYQLCLKQTSKILRGSALESQLPESALPDIFLGDTIGNLWEYYAASDCVFLGGSLVPIGGHNLLEPAALGLPIVVGPYLFTITEMSECFIGSQGLKSVSDSQALETVIDEMLSNPNLAKAQGARALELVKQNQGALRRLLDLIDTIIFYQKID